MQIKLAVFDFDSTLMDGETIDNLALDFGVYQEVSAITKSAMEGEIDFFESLCKRVAMLEGMKESRAIAVCENLPLITGAKECIATLKSFGIKVVCFSGGFSFATNHFAKILGLDADFSNVLHIKNGILTGKVGGHMMFGDSKGQMLHKIQSLLGISQEETMSVGDGANDISMFQYSSLKIAFCAKEALQKYANAIIDTKDLREVLGFVY